MKDLSDFKFYVSDTGFSYEGTIHDTIEDAAYYAWTRRESGTQFIVMDCSNSTEDDTEFKDIGHLSYDNEAEIYYWFNISNNNIAGFPVESPEDILEMLEINPVIGSKDPEDDDSPEPYGIQDNDAIIVDTDGFGYESKEWRKYVNGENIID